MIPRISKRYASTAKPNPKSRKGTKGLNGATPQRQPVSPEEQARAVQRRIEKAERDERMDITMALTPVKTYMGGFTRPRDLRALYWSKNGPYDEQKRSYETPSAAAYVPHTVYLLEARYLTKHGVGRADSIEHVVGVCRECDFPDILARYNSAGSPGIETMDNARWPWVARARAKRVKWWNPGEDPKELARGFTEDSQHEAEDGAAFSSENEEFGVAAKGALILPKVTTTGQQVRAFHSSARHPYPSESYNEEHIVPNFYVKHKKDRKRQAEKLMKSPVTPSTTSPSATDAAGPEVEAAEEAAHDPTRQIKAVKRRKHEESALMEHLSDSILGDDLVASTRRLVTKIPVESYDKDGNLVHPSGFVVPGKGHSSTSDAARAKERSRDEDEERAAQTASVAERVLESDFDHVHSAMASTRPRSHKVPFEIREPDGTVKHPSGFVPPTPANEFKYSDSASLERGLAGAISRQRARDAGNTSSTIVKGRRLHTTAVVRASEVALPTCLSQPVPATEVDSQVSPEPSESEPDLVRTTRAKYLPTLAQKPFFRPLLTLTVSTRPLANSLVRLSRALPRGLPFYASIEPEDRKFSDSFSSRMRNLRLNRMQDLAVAMAQELSGARGGFVGIRFSPQERGRGVDGEGLEKALDWDKRVIGVGIGNWFPRAQELKEGFKMDSEEKITTPYTSEGTRLDSGPFKVYGLDAWGKRICDETGKELAYPSERAPAKLSALEEAQTEL
ncbi:hypothetical protein DEU56DRAFT_909130 [Suillus clintonianus]|uniref:uncharacterized protein n=1 Tax=Suillus clintonianus TaxID=1904413 RepID=UPI001B8860D1|nr:uncharacterized protein DEU56DRAFT_909130 [Suillus clintonianus]KAG2148815.1 hypothetical protein DEU56DRAFT_909130 [Suillus clintonianus]